MSVFFYGCVTLDGYLADKNHGLSWLHETGSPEETDCDRFYQAMDVAIMGRRTFEEVARRAWGRTRTSGSSAETPSWPRCWSGTWWTI